MEYLIFLPDEKAKSYRYLSLVILLINLLAFIFLLSQTNKQSHLRLLSLGTGLSTLSLALFLVNFFTGKIAGYRPEISFFISGFIFLLVGIYLFGTCVIALGLLGIYLNSRLQIRLSKHGIKYPSFPSKTFLWTDLNQVLLKDRVLTIDFHDNRLIQVVIAKESWNIEEKKFNDFCLVQVEKATLLNGQTKETV